jgi:hypothetical protein
MGVRMSTEYVCHFSETIRKRYNVPEFVSYSGDVGTLPKLLVYNSSAILNMETNEWYKVPSFDCVKDDTVIRNPLTPVDMIQLHIQDVNSKWVHYTFRQNRPWPL